MAGLSKFYSEIIETDQQLVTSKKTTYLYILFIAKAEVNTQKNNFN